MGRRRLALLIATGLALSGLLPAGIATAAETDQDGFTFGAVGDNGADGPRDPGDSTSRTLRLIGENRPAFVQSLGDLAYDASAAAGVHDGGDWCAWTRAQIAQAGDGVAVPYIIAAGNHEAQDAKAGFAIEDYTRDPACADPFASRTSFPTDAATDAAKDSFYDYPAEHPLLRVISIGPGLTYVHGGLRDYSRGSALYRWVERAILDAQADGEWVVLTHHVPYLNAGTSHGSEMSNGYYTPTAPQFGDIFDLAVTTRVDLILNGHEHDYQRSKQLRLSDACPVITHDQYVPACVSAADGSPAAPYRRGEGPVQVIVGTGGHGPTAVDDADGDRPYMLVADAGADNCGYASFTVTAAALTGTFENACDGTLTDTFTIASDTSTPSPAEPTASPPSSAPADAPFPLATVLGTAAGGLVLLAVVATILVVRRRRR